ncbi:ABC transporter ATP-binding protein [Candidatus Formimonas warabiya]|uniref:Nickel import system ATP-binding protein NikD n=1 Tax=Formimonas warabiya TaxID=1761012 RepID=A0A3G1KXU1_FORW1|nr:ABC transporter ATP-binding protein [Candidatus Formimonas warabiya]ATW27179.1 dipeptide ABC transporter ATP-binding protein DppD [Candidatus Formimonas warabiya]
MQENILEVSNLKTYFDVPRGTVKAVDGISLTLKPGETIGVVGESGCGKSVLGLSILNLITPPGRIKSGSVHFKGKNLFSCSEAELSHIRGKEMAMIFQEPLRSLNPVRTVGDQIAEVLQIHEGMSKTEALQKAVQLLKQVEVTDPGRRVHNYPHEFSGGMRQRAMIAMGLACNPQVLLADEPTAGLDVTIQAQILDLMKRLKESAEMAMLLITHDLAIVSQMCSRVLVMYAGQVVEQGSVREVLHHPKHPYTRALLDAIPGAAKDRNRLGVLKGISPDPADLPQGCHFHTRCPNVTEKCRIEEPTEVVDGETVVKCWARAEKGAITV